MDRKAEGKKKTRRREEISGWDRKIKTKRISSQHRKSVGEFKA
jgi:hypothetical protein